MKKILGMGLLSLSILCLASCSGSEKPSIDNPNNPTQNPSEDIEVPTENVKTEWDYKIKLPSTELLEEASNIEVIEDAPDIMIIGAVLDTFEFFNYETMSAYEYVKVYNNTNNEYNLKNHRIILANPMQGQNYESEEAKKGLKPLSTGFLFNGLIDNDFILPAKSIGLIWMHPYYWTCGSGNKGSTGVFSTDLMHDDADKKGAFNQTIDDFKAFWDMEDSKVPVYKLTNMGIAGKMNMGGSITSMYPIFSPGAGVAYTHINPGLLRSIEIQKFNDQNGNASIDLLNKYEDLSDEKKVNPDAIYGKQAFNVMEIKENNEVIDGYNYTNTWKYWNPISRINFCGRVNVAKMNPGQTEVDFSGTSNPGVEYLEPNIELQFRAPRANERVMQWQLPLRERSNYETYMKKSQLDVMRFSKENVTTLKYVEKTIKLSVDPALGIDLINWRADEVKSEGRMSCAAPTKIHTINVIAPKESN